MRLEQVEIGELKMRIVRQPVDSYLCMAACVAMICEVDLDYVLEKAEFKNAPDGSGKKYLGDTNAVIFLAQHGWRYGSGPHWPEGVKFKEGCEISISVDCIEVMRAMVSVDSEIYDHEGGHSVVWCPDQRMILDPQYGVLQPVHRYTIREWIPVAKIYD